MYKLTIEGATLAELLASAAALAGLAGGGNTGIVSSAPTGVNNTTPNHGTTTDPDSGPANPNAPANDSAGLPWDERIHSGNRAQNADGTWRKKRGVDAGLVAHVEMELRNRGVAAVAAQQPAFNPAQQFQPNQPVQQQTFQPNPTQQFNPNAGQPQQTFQPNPGFDPNAQQFNPNASQGQVQQPPVAPAAVQQTQAAPLDFGAFMQAVSGAMHAGRLNQQDIVNVCQQLGLQNIALLQNDPARLSAAVEMLRGWGKL